MDIHLNESLIFDLILEYGCSERSDLRSQMPWIGSVGVVCVRLKNVAPSSRYDTLTTDVLLRQ